MQLGANVRAALGNMLAKAVSVPLEKVCRLLLFAVAARTLKEVAFGRFQFADTVAALLVLATDLGIGMWTTRALARRRHTPQEIVGTGMWVRSLAAAPYLALVGVTALLGAERQPDTRRALLCLGIAALAGVFIEYCGAIFRGHERLRDEAHLNVVRAVLVTLAGLGALAWQPSVGALAAGVMLGSVSAAVHGLWIVRYRYRLPTPFANKPFDSSLRRSLARTAIRQAFPLWLATLMSLVYFKGDAVLLRLWAGDAAVGAYSAAFKIFEGTMILPSIVLAASFPSLVRAHDQVQVHARLHAQARAHRRRAELGLGLGLLGLGALVGGILWATSATVIRLAFGPTFANAVPALRVLSLAIPLLFANYGLTHFLIARHLERYNLAFTIGLVILNLGSNWVLIPRWGALGAAWATLGTELALSVCCMVMLAERSPASSSPEPPRTPPPEPSATNKVRRSE